MRLILTRHGETVENQQGIMQGHLPGHLSQLGKEQAKKLALRLKEENIDAIYSSDLARAADTAKEIAKFHPNATFKFVKELRERNLGEFQGKKKSDFGWDPKEFKATRIQPKEGETMEELYDRANKFLHKILQKHKDDTVLFVGHNGIGKALIAVITDKPYTEISNIENLSNTSINVYEIDEKKNHKILLTNCTKHLK